MATLLHEAMTMPTIIERDGRFTAQVRRTGYGSVARTFDTEDEATAWSETVERAVKAHRAQCAIDPATPPLKLEQFRERKGENIRPVDMSASGVYFLYKGSQCVYVGQSFDVHSRVKQHEGRIDFDTYSWMPVIPEMLRETEAFYISAMKPPINKAGVSSALPAHKMLLSSFVRAVAQ